MATEENNGSTEGTSGQEQQGQQQDPTPGTGANEGQQQAPAINSKTRLPDDHPLIVSYGEVKEKLAKQATELAEAQANSAKASKLQQELDARPTPEALAALQTRNDRLEEFLQAVGGPLGRALDSRSFTRDLFESDKDVKDIVKDFLKANPTATAAALGSAAAAPGAGKANPNDLIRAAFNGSKN